MMAAGMPSNSSVRNPSRSSSVPSASRGESRGGASRRYESPLSHVGQRLLHR
jgi:hypothetical protein